jgi:hypothetical protein
MLCFQSVPDGCGRNRHPLGKQEIVLESTIVLDTNLYVHLVNLIVMIGGRYVCTWNSKSSSSSGGSSSTSSSALRRGFFFWMCL